MSFKKLFFYAMLSYGTMALAQSPEQREEIKKSINADELERLKQKFHKDYDLQEAKVVEYLKANPSVERSFTKNGSLYYLKSIDKNGKPVYINTKSNIESGELIKANTLYSGGSIGAAITGTGMVVGVWDGGQVKATHELLTGKVTMQAGQTVTSVGGDNHMTHVSGTIVGKELTSNGAIDGTDRATARGIAYNATAQCYDWDNDIAEMTTFATNGYLISNHSYGLGNGPTQDAWTFGAYNDTATQWDALLKNAPNYLPFVAAGNEQESNGSTKTGTLQGYDVITGSSAAKNVVTVGAVNADRTMSSYSNFGPTDDGRIKPDICARGTGINSSQATSDTAYSGNGSDSSGTSYASPAAAAALLLQQYYYSLNNSYMSASMLKAILLHSADDEGTPGPDAKFGWGILNIERAAQIIKDAKFTGKARLHTFTTNPTNNSSSEISISGNGTTSTTPGTESGTLKASICWTDDEGVEQTSTDGVDPTASRLVYNFDMLFRRQSPFVQVRPYKNLTIADPTATATAGSNWFENNVDNYKQANITTGGGTVGETYFLYLRKSTSSPAAVRNVSVVITGLAQSSTLSNDEFLNQNDIVFYSKEDHKIKFISNNNESFNLYNIYDITGKLIANGKTNSNEITFDNVSSGVYIINFGNETNKKSVKFIKN